MILLNCVDFGDNPYGSVDTEKFNFGHHIETLNRTNPQNKHRKHIFTALSCKSTSDNRSGLFRRIVLFAVLQRSSLRENLTMRANKSSTQWQVNIRFAKFCALCWGHEFPVNLTTDHSSGLLSHFVLHPQNCEISKWLKKVSRNI